MVGASLLEGPPPTDDLFEFAEAFAVQLHRSGMVQSYRCEALQAFMVAKASRRVSRSDSHPGDPLVRQGRGRGPGLASSDLANLGGPDFGRHRHGCGVAIGGPCLFRAEDRALRRKAEFTGLIDAERVVGAGHP